jgi:Domain of unknown function (DUF4404)
MIDRHIDHLESRIRNAEGLSEERRTELLGLLESLRREAASLPPQAQGKAEADVPADRPVDDVVSEIQGSLAGFEASHPKLTDLTNQVAMVLSNMGI